MARWAMIGSFCIVAPPPVRGLGENRHIRRKVTQKQLRICAELTASVAIRSASVVVVLAFTGRTTGALNRAAGGGCIRMALRRPVTVGRAQKVFNTEETGRTTEATEQEQFGASRARTIARHVLRTSGR